MFIILPSKSTHRDSISPLKCLVKSFPYLVEKLLALHNFKGQTSILKKPQMSVNGSVHLNAATFAGTLERDLVWKISFSQL